MFDVLRPASTRGEAAVIVTNLHLNYKIIDLTSARLRTTTTPGLFASLVLSLFFMFNVLRPRST